MKEQENGDYSHVLKYTGLFGGVQGLSMILSLVRNKFMALLLGAGGMGFASLLNSVQNFSSQCTNLGISFGAVPRLSELYEKGDVTGLEYFITVIRLWSLVAAFLGLVFCIAVSSFVDEMTFTWGNHTLHYAMLAFSVAMIAITGGETAILKATRRLGSLAKIQVSTGLVSLVVSIPLYYFLFHSGVVPVIVLMALVTMLVTMCYSYRYYPLRLKVGKRLLAEGAGMIRLGVAFVLAAVIGSAAEMLVRAFLNVEGGLADVGLYNAVYMITFTYAGLVFSAMDSDYFPRLSAVSQDVEVTNQTVNRQIEVSLLIISPMLAGLMVMLPVLIPLLFSAEFLPIVEVTQVAILAMYMKVLTMPVAYITLARGYSMSYLLLELSYFVVFVLLIMLGYWQWGIYGTGVAIVVAHVFDYVLINGYAYWKYGYRCTASVLRYAAMQVALGLAVFVLTCLVDGLFYWIIGAALTLVSTAYSVSILHSKTHLWKSLLKRLRFS